MNEFIYDENGEVVRSYGALQDITEHVALQEQLRQAQKLEVVGQLTGGIAHDFNNLMAIILGNTELMSHSLNREGSNISRLDTIVSAAERAANLTQHLLAFSRRQSLNPRSLQLNEHLAGMLALLERTLGKRIQLIISHAEALWPCYADPVQTENALLNLAINSRDALGGEGEIVVQSKNVELNSSDALVPAELAEGKYVTLVVTDKGAGMTEEVLNQALEPFYTTKEIGKGSGLGLSMVYGFAKQSDGHLVLESKLGEGTRVTIYLPVAKEDQQTTNALSDNPEIVVPGGSGKVLLVEDDPDLLFLATELLEELGYQVIPAQDSVQALDKIQSLDKLDLLLTDVVISGELNGPELARQVLQLKPEAKVLYMSGYMESDVFEEAQMEAGINFLRKPFRQSELASIVHRLLEGGDTDNITT